MEPLILALVALLLSACAVEQWRNADLQLDVAGAGLSDEDIVRVCVVGSGQYEQAVGAGRIAVPGLPADEPAMVEVHLVQAAADSGATTADSFGHAGPVALDAGTSYAEVSWAEAVEAEALCEDGWGPVPTGQPSWLLAVRFRD